MDNAMLDRVHCREYADSCCTRRAVLESARPTTPLYECGLRKPSPLKTEKGHNVGGVSVVTSRFAQEYNKLHLSKPFDH